MKASAVRLPSACLGLVITLFSSPVIAAKYSVTELVPAHDDTWTLPVAINIHGDVAGESSSNLFDPSAIVWKSGVPQILPPLSGSSGGGARGINDSGQVSGFSSSDSSGNIPTLWTNGIPASLASASFPTGDGRGINSTGKVVGYTDAFPSQPVLWNGPRPLDVPLPNPNYVFVDAINDSGQAVGPGSWLDGTRAILWDTTTGNATILPPIGAATSAKAFGINNSGQVVGLSSATIPVRNHAVVWNNLMPDDLGVPLGTVSEAVGINSFGDVVGASGSISPFNQGLVTTDMAGLATAFLWSDGVAVNLFEESDAQGKGWTYLTAAYGINDVGQIIGEGLINGQFRGFLLTPIPEPETCLLLAVGISLVGWRITRWRTER